MTVAKIEIDQSWNSGEPTYSPAGHLYATESEASWAIFFEKILGGDNFLYSFDGVDGLPRGFQLSYDGDFPNYYGVVVDDLTKLSPEQWKQLLNRKDDLRAVILLDGMPDLRMYLTPELVFDPYNSGDGSAITEAERLGYKPPEHATQIARCGWGLYPYKDDPFFDEHFNYYHFDNAETYHELLEAVVAARQPLFKQLNMTYKNPNNFHLVQDKELRQKVETLSNDYKGPVSNAVYNFECITGKQLSLRDLFGLDADIEVQSDVSSLAAKTYADHLRLAGFHPLYKYPLTQFDLKLLERSFDRHALLTGIVTPPEERARISPHGERADSVIGCATDIFKWKLRLDLFGWRTDE